MGATVIVAVRRALVAAVASLDAFQGVPVMFTYKATEQREFAYTRAARFTHNPAGMKSGRNFRNEEGRFEFVIWVESVGDSPEDAALRALDLGLVFEEYVADHKQGIGGAYTLTVDGDGTLAEAVLDSSSLAELVYPVKYNARLT